MLFNPSDWKLYSKNLFAIVAVCSAAFFISGSIQKIKENEKDAINNKVSVSLLKKRVDRLEDKIEFKK